MTEQRTVFIFVCGILTFPGSHSNWTGKAVTWTHLHTPHRAEKIEYIVGPISRALGQKRRVAKLRKTLAYYEGWRIVLAGHSNGCDVSLDTLNQEDVAWTIHRLHLISAACDENCHRNGLEQMLQTGAVGKCSVWIAGSDWPLRIAGTGLGRVFGYGSMGLTGPTNNTAKIDVLKHADYGHSDWFRDDNFDETMKTLTGGIDA